MPHPYRYWLALHPDIRRPIGGVKQVHRLAEALTHLGRESRIIQDNAEFHPGWFKTTHLQSANQNSIHAVILGLIEML